MRYSEERLNLVYNFIKTYLANKGFPPSYREISAATGIKSTNSVKDYIDKLKEQNLIRTTDSKNRCIEIVSNKENDVTSQHFSQIPLVGQVAAGIPILAEQNIEDTFTFSSNLFGRKDDLFMLKVKGESMKNIGINNGDYVVVKQQNVAENGEIVVAMIDNEATVKNIYYENDKIRLQPQNDNYQPIYTKKVAILGKVIGVIKMF